MPPQVSCSCGCTKSHIVAYRETADSRTIKFWSDGAITDLSGVWLRGLGPSQSRYAAKLARRVNDIIMNDINVYDIAEVVPLVKAVRAGVARGGWFCDSDAVNYARRAFNAAAKSAA